MARPKSIIIDPLKLLAAIDSAATSELASLRVEVAKLDADRSANSRNDFPLRWELQLTEALGTRYDVPRFMGRPVTPTERIRVQEQIRQLRAEGLLETDGPPARWVRLTEAGRERLTKLKQPHTAEADRPAACD